MDDDRTLVGLALAADTSAAGRLLLVAVIVGRGPEGACSASVEALAAACGLTSKAASRRLVELERDGWIEVSRATRKRAARTLGPKLRPVEEASSEALEVPLDIPPQSGISGTSAPDVSPPSAGHMSPPSGGQRDTPPGSGTYVPPGSGIRVPCPPDGGDNASRAGASALLVFNPPTPQGEEEEGEFERARRELRRLVSDAWLRRRAIPVNADDVNERRIAGWLWTAAGERLEGFRAIAGAIVAAWEADPYLGEVGRPWAHLQSSLTVLATRAAVRAVRPPGPTADAEAHYRAAEQALVEARSWGSVEDEARALEALEAARRALLAVAS